MVMLHRATTAKAASRAIGSNGAIPHRVTCKARKRPDYAGRRSGSDPENLRRASSRGGHERMPHPEAQHMDSRFSQPSSKPGMDPRVLRRRSVDYSARRSGGDPENQRRRSASYSPSPSYTPDTQDTSSYSTLPPSNGPKMDPRVQRRRSVDYAARRSGGSSSRDRSASARRSSAPKHSAPTSSPASYRDSHYSKDTSHSPRPDRRVVHRKSIDYSARRGGDPENSRRRVSANPAAFHSSSGTRPIPRRKSFDYASRRSGGQEENARRSRDYSHPTSTSHDSNAAGAPASAGNGALPGPPITARDALARVRAMAQNRRATPDYAARRSGGDPENQRRRSVSMPPMSYGDSRNGASGSQHSSNGAQARAEERTNKPYIARKAIPSYESRRTRDYEGRPGHPQRRRSMARFNLNEVKSALANRAKVLAAQRGNGTGGTSVLDNGARADYGEYALRSVEGLMGEFSNISGVPVRDLKANLSLSDVSVAAGRDPAEDALRSLEAVAGLFKRASRPVSSTW